MRGDVDRLHTDCPCTRKPTIHELSDGLQSKWTQAASAVDLEIKATKPKEESRYVK